MTSIISESDAAVAAGFSMDWSSGFCGCPDVFIKPVESLVPEPAVEIEPLRRRLQAVRIERAAAEFPLPFLPDQCGALQYTQMARYRRPRNFERRGEIVDGCIARGQARDNGPARRIGKGGKSKV